MFQETNLIGADLSVFKENYCANYNNSNKYLELGEISLKENYYLDEAQMFEVRSNNYLNEKHLEEYFNVQHKGLQSLLGYGEDGQVIKKNNLIYIKYPIDLLEAYGGVYKEEELLRKSRRKMRPGMDLVVEYYYPKSDLTFSIEPGRITINASWESPGTYKIYRGRNDLGETLDENNEAIYTFIKTSIEEEELVFVDTTIESGTEYWYSVRINEYPKSNSYGVVAK